MGKMFYNSNMGTDFDDRLLVHLQIVIGAKLRRNESFFFSWNDDQSVGHGRSVIWLHPAVPIRFKFVGSRMPTINRLWLAQLSEAANSGGGLIVLAEPENVATPTPTPKPTADG